MIKNRVLSNAPIHLAFVTDGDRAQILGICLILRALRRRLAKRERSTVWVAAPERSHQTAALWLTATECEADFRFLKAEPRRDDRYFIQLFLVDVFEQVNASQTLTCLDYDHIILDSEGFPFHPSAFEVKVSSETRKSVAPDVLCVFGDQRSLATLNTSLLIGTGSSLRCIGRYWLSAYNELRKVAAKRFLTETAFGLAALRAGVLTSPSSSAVQGNFANRTHSCAAFHYGGDSLDAQKMKHLLMDHAESLGTSGPAGEDFDRIATLLQEMLMRG
jgi:hypothetical protein